MQTSYLGFGPQANIHSFIPTSFKWVLEITHVQSPNKLTTIDNQSVVCLPLILCSSEHQVPCTTGQCSYSNSDPCHCPSYKHFITRCLERTSWKAGYYCPWSTDKKAELKIPGSRVEKLWGWIWSLTFFCQTPCYAWPLHMYCLRPMACTDFFFNLWVFVVPWS